MEISYLLQARENPDIALAHDAGAGLVDMQQATAASITASVAIQATIRDIGEITAAIASAGTEQGTVTRDIASAFNRQG